MRNSYAAMCILLLVLLTTAACRKNHHTATRGFYYWKTAYRLSDYEQQRLAQSGCSRLYLRYFDVDWDEAANHPVPVAIVRMQQEVRASFDYTPVVFITQKALSKLGTAQVPELAGNIEKLLSGISSSSSIHPTEIQIDCDWTAGTRDRYFSLLKALKSLPFVHNKKLSCTVRLHQVKYRERSGIPPVDRALIMCYNVGNLKQAGAHNSILDAALAKDYLAALDTYPLPADIALPLFSWCLHFRMGKLKGILRDIAPDAVTNNAAFASVKGNVYTCKKDTLWQGYSFLAGDELRVETPALSALKEVASFTAGKVRNDSMSILFFHIDSLILSKYPPYDLETVYRTYH